MNDRISLLPLAGRRGFVFRDLRVRELAVGCGPMSIRGTDAKGMPFRAALALRFAPGFVGRAGILWDSEVFTKYRVN